MLTRTITTPNIGWGYSTFYFIRWPTALTRLLPGSGNLPCRTQLHTAVPPSTLALHCLCALHTLLPSLPPQVPHHFSLLQSACLRCSPLSVLFHRYFYHSVPACQHREDSRAWTPCIRPFLLISRIYPVPIAHALYIAFLT